MAFRTCAHLQVCRCCLSDEASSHTKFLLPSNFLVLLVHAAQRGVRSESGPHAEPFNDHSLTRAACSVRTAYSFHFSVRSRRRLKSEGSSEVSEVDLPERIASGRLQRSVSHFQMLSACGASDYILKIIIFKFNSPFLLGLVLIASPDARSASSKSLDCVRQRSEFEIQFAIASD